MTWNGGQTAKTWKSDKCSWQNRSVLRAQPLPRPAFPSLLRPKASLIAHSTWSGSNWQGRQAQAWKNEPPQCSPSAAQWSDSDWQRGRTQLPNKPLAACWSGSSGHSGWQRGQPMSSKNEPSERSPPAAYDAWSSPRYNQPQSLKNELHKQRSLAVPSARTGRIVRYRRASQQTKSKKGTSRGATFKGTRPKQRPLTLQSKQKRRSSSSDDVQLLIGGRGSKSVDLIRVSGSYRTCLMCSMGCELSCNLRSGPKHRRVEIDVISAFDETMKETFSLEPGVTDSKQCPSCKQRNISLQLPDLEARTSRPIARVPRRGAFGWCKRGAPRILSSTLGARRRRFSKNERGT